MEIYQKENLYDFIDKNILGIISDDIQKIIDLNLYLAKIKDAINKDIIIKKIFTIMDLSNDQYNKDAWVKLLRDFNYTHGIITVDKDFKCKLKIKKCTVDNLINWIWLEEDDFYLPLFSPSPISSFGIDMQFLHKPFLKWIMYFPILFFRDPRSSIHRSYYITFYQRLHKFLFYETPKIFLTHFNITGSYESFLLDKIHEHLTIYNKIQTYLQSRITKELSREYVAGFESICSDYNLIAKCVDEDAIKFRNFQSIPKTIFRAHSNTRNDHLSLTTFIKYKDLFINIFLLDFCMARFTSRIYGDDLQKLNKPINETMRLIYRQERSLIALNKIINSISNVGIQFQEKI